MEQMDQCIPAGARLLLSCLRESGYESWLVGGCVRDLLMGTHPHDWDICTNAKPEAVLHICPTARAYPTGLRHGTVLLVLPDGAYEVTTYRAEGEYADHRHPNRVEFVSRLSDDLARRDFTINAMAYRPGEGLVDLYGGREDLYAGVIRCVGKPDQRMEEDALRILRALRFAARFSFAIEEKTADAMRKNAPLLREIARERILTEWKAFLQEKAITALLIDFSQVFVQAIPQLAVLTGEKADRNAPAWRECAELAGALPPDPPLRFACLLSHIAPEEELENSVRRVLLDLKSDAVFREEVVLLTVEARKPFPADGFRLRRRLLELGEGPLRKLFQLFCAQESRQGVGEAQLEHHRRLLEQVIADTPCRSLRQLNVRGTDLTALGIAPGPAVGSLLTQALFAVADREVENERQALLQWCEQHCRTQREEV